MDKCQIKTNSVHKDIQGLLCTVRPFVWFLKNQTTETNRIDYFVPKGGNRNDGSSRPTATAEARSVVDRIPLNGRHR